MNNNNKGAPGSTRFMTSFILLNNDVNKNFFSHEQNNFLTFLIFLEKNFFYIIKRKWQRSHSHMTYLKQR